MLIRGTIRGTRQRFAFLHPEDGGEDHYVAEDQLGGAIHGDYVEAVLLRRSFHDFRPEVSIERIIERRLPEHTGDVVRLARTTFVRPDAAVLPDRIRLKTGGAPVAEGCKVIFRLDPPAPGTPQAATLVRVIGDADDPALDLLVVATFHRLPGRFPDEVIDEALAAAERSDSADLASRANYTDRFVLTIDPKDAKDFDDAISIQEDESGYRLQVHIADVSWFVPAGGAVDLEAARRGNSVYFPGSVIPMLPESLSTRMASLVPGEDRRTMTVEIDLDAEARPHRATIRQGLIRSAARLHYEQAQRILDGEPADPALTNALKMMARLARRLRQRRFERGGFDLDLPEVEMKLDPTGVPKRIWRHETFETNRIIEEFMILANRTVGGILSAAGWPLIYRVHGEPDVQALERFAEVALTLVPSARSRDVESIPALRAFLAGLPEGKLTRIVHGFFLRSMKQAVYAPVDIGHFGLGIDRYCHFTSPIRRYPDLFNHRLVRSYLSEGRLGRDGERERAAHDAARIHAAHCTSTGITAEKAEREAVRLKTLRWAQRRLGERHRGHVIGLLPGGFFVELDDVPVEGFVPRDSLEGRAIYVDERLAFVESGSRNEIRLGDSVEVQLSRVDLRERRLFLQLVRASGPGRTSGLRGARRGRGRPGRVKPAKRAAVKSSRASADARKGRTPPRPRKGKRSHRGGRP